MFWLKLRQAVVLPEQLRVRRCFRQVCAAWTASCAVSLPNSLPITLLSLLHCLPLLLLSVANLSEQASVGQTKRKMTSKRALEWPAASRTNFLTQADF